MVFFSRSNLGPGQSTPGFTLPTANNDGTGSQSYVLLVFRDGGATLADGTLDIDQSAAITVVQDEILLASLGHTSATACAFSPNPAGGTITVSNLGPGFVSSLQVVDGAELR